MSTVALLGDGLASVRSCPKAAYLDEAMRHGLRVPAGVICTEPWVRQFEGSKDLGALTERLESLEERGPIRSLKIAVRSAFSSEDGTRQSRAGHYRTVLGVEARAPSAVATAIEQVIDSATEAPDAAVPTERTVLIQRMVEAEVAGVAFIERDYERDVVEWIDGTADALVSGRVSGERLQLPKLQKYERLPKSVDAPSWAERLAKLLRSVRRHFGDRDWDIEWADDGRECWLIQLRPITASPSRDEWWTSANFRELFPDPPSRLMSSIVVSSSDALFGHYRKYDPELPTGRSFARLVQGRPVFNLSLLSNMLESWGLPTSLVTDSIGSRNVEPGPFRILRVLRHLPTLTRQAWDQHRAPKNALRFRETIDRIAARRPEVDRLDRIVSEFQPFFIELVATMAGLSSALSTRLSILRRLGVLELHARRQRTSGTELFDALESLERDVVRSDPKVVAALSEGRAPDSAEFTERFEAILDRHGHRGPFESDLAQPRYRERPELLYPALLATAPQRRERSKPPLRIRVLGLLTFALGHSLNRLVSARESLRSDSIRAFERTRQRLLDRADQLVSEGLLPETRDVFRMTSEELRALEQGWHPLPSFWKQRSEDESTIRNVQLSEPFRLSDLGRDLADATRGSAHGLTLSGGMVRGRALKLVAPANVNRGDSKEPVVLIAPAIDPGWVPVFRQVDGVAVEMGGDLSHGSIILREIGLPAVTNARGVMQQIESGDRVELDATHGVVKKINES